VHDDEAAIQRVISTYSQHASLAEWDAVLALFLPDAVWEIPHLGMTLDGAAAIRGALTGFFAEMDYVLQLNAPAVIDVDGDRAAARSGIREAGKSRGKDEGFEFFGLYDDRLVRTADGWKFAHRTFRGVGTHYFPLHPA
jgi:ketosteroid isomerase-like protein